MTRRFALILALALSISACASAPESQLGPDGKPLPRVYHIGPGSGGKIDYRVLDSVNALRGAAGVGQVALNAALNAAAETHSRDMSVQNRPWHFGSDGSSPIDRLRRVGYAGNLVGETISESYETELETLSAWMGQQDTRDVILSAEATRLGLSWFQEESGKIWWTMVLGN